MKTFTMPLLAATLLAMSSAASAGQISIAPIERGVANVLVNVGADGSIKNFSVAEKFPPKIERLLEATLRGLVVTPSAASSSRRVGQVVLRFALKSTPKPDGNYSVEFVAFDSKPVPIGSWYWATYDQRQLALVDRNTWRQRRSYPEPMDSAPRTAPTYRSEPNPPAPASQASAARKS